MRGYSSGDGGAYLKWCSRPAHPIRSLCRVGVAEAVAKGRVWTGGNCRSTQVEDEKGEIYLERSSEMFTKFSPQLLGVSLCIRSPRPQKAAYFSISNVVA